MVKKLFTYIKLEFGICHFLKLDEIIVELFHHLIQNLLLFEQSIAQIKKLPLLGVNFIKMVSQTLDLDDLFIKLDLELL